GGIERRREHGVAAAGKGIILPDETVGGEEEAVASGAGAEKAELIDERLGAGAAVQLLRAGAGAAAGERHQDAGGAGLMLGAVPHRADVEIGAKRARLAALAPERAGELQQRFRRAAVDERVERVTLGVGESRLEADAAHDRRGG